MRIKEIYETKEVSLVDVRTPIEFQCGSVIGAINIPMNEVVAKIDELKKMEPLVVEALSRAELALQPVDHFEAATSSRTFRIMASDYIETTLIAPLLGRLNEVAPHVTLDILTPSDASFADLERGEIDMAINRFDHLPDSFHQKSIWRDF